MQHASRGDRQVCLEGDGEMGKVEGPGDGGGRGLPGLVREAKPCLSPEQRPKKAQTECLAKPASASQEATSCGANSTGCQENCVQTQCHLETPKGVTLGNYHPFPGLLCPTCTVQDWGTKDLCSHGLWGSRTAPRISSSQNFPREELPLLEAPSDAISQSSQRPKEGATPALCPVPTLQGPGHAPLIHPIFHSVPRAKYPLGQRPYAYLTISPILCRELLPRPRSCPRL